jgi:hypothetical protein
LVDLKSVQDSELDLLQLNDRLSDLLFAVAQSDNLTEVVLLSVFASHEISQFQPNVFVFDHSVVEGHAVSLRKSIEHQGTSWLSVKGVVGFAIVKC